MEGKLNSSYNYNPKVISITMDYHYYNVPVNMLFYSDIMENVMRIYCNNKLKYQLKINKQFI